MKHSIRSGRNSLCLDGIHLPGRDDLTGHDTLEVVLHRDLIHQCYSGRRSDGLDHAAILISLHGKGSPAAAGSEIDLGSRAFSIDRKTVPAFRDRKPRPRRIRAEAAPRFHMKCRKSGQRKLSSRLKPDLDHLPCGLLLSSLSPFSMGFRRWLRLLLPRGLTGDHPWRSMDSHCRFSRDRLRRCHGCRPQGEQQRQ